MYIAGYVGGCFVLTTSSISIHVEQCATMTYYAMHLTHILTDISTFMTLFSLHATGQERKIKILIVFGEDEQSLLSHSP